MRDFWSPAFFVAKLQRIASRFKQGNHQADAFPLPVHPMQDPEVDPKPVSAARIFLPAWDQHNKPSKIVTLGHYYPQGKILVAKNVIREADQQGYRANSDIAPDRSINTSKVRDHIAWTRLINALNNERQWPLKRLYEKLDAMMEPGIAIAVVPPHIAHQAFWPLRTFAKNLAAHDRIDATSSLVRHTTIRRIIFGGPSSRALHRQTIQVKDTKLVQGQRVLLLDDIAKSGASLITCRELLYEAGAEQVQAVAIGRVIVDFQG